MVGQTATWAAALRAPAPAPCADGEERDLPLRIAAFCCGATSVWVLLAHMYGIMTAPHFAAFVYAPATLGMFALPAIARRRGLHRFVRLFWWSLLAGFIATCVYDLCRVPLWSQGYPFGAITKMGFLLLATQERSALVEAVGWLYHFTNGCGFAVMFAMALPRGKWDLAFLWALFLEACMVFTPYSDALHIKRGPGFLMGSFYAHVLYGLALGGALHLLRRRIHPR